MAPAQLASAARPLLQSMAIAGRYCSREYQPKAITRLPPTRYSRQVPHNGHDHQPNRNHCHQQQWEFYLLEIDSGISNVAKIMDTTYPRTPASIGDESEPVVTAACVNCRAKHLKCNGEKPCPRCLSRNQICSYVQSRRGYRPRRRVTAAYAASSLPGMLFFKESSAEILKFM